MASLQQVKCSFKNFLKSEAANTVIYVAGALMIMAVIAADIRNHSRQTVLAQGLELSILKQEIAAESVSRLAVYLYSKSPEVRHGVCTYNDTHLVFSVFPASSLMDLNETTPEELELLLVKLESNSDAVQAIVDSFEQYRSVYLNTAAPYPLEETGYFQHINQFRNLAGMTDDIFEKTRPYLTVDAFSSVFNFEAAPPLLREIYTHLDEPRIEAGTELFDIFDRDEALLVEVRLLGTEFAGPTSHYYSYTEARNMDVDRWLKHSFKSDASLGKLDTVRTEKSQPVACKTLLNGV